MTTVLKCKCRWTPWDERDRIGRSGSLMPQGDIESDERTRSGGQEILRLHGLYFFDPAKVSALDVQRFMWAGLRLLRAEAAARSMPQEHIRRLLVSAFDVFQDTADSIWTSLKTIVSQPASSSSPSVPPATIADPFVACEEDRPNPVMMTFSEPLVRLDPDAGILASFKP